MGRTSKKKAQRWRGQDSDDEEHKKDKKLVFLSKSVL